MREGWVCPKCGKVYSPTWFQYQVCNQDSDETERPGRDPFGVPRLGTGHRTRPPNQGSAGRNDIQKRGNGD
jgi:hypothetical protein